MEIACRASSSDGGLPPDSEPQNQRRRQVLRRGRHSCAPKSSLTPSLRFCPEGLSHVGHATFRSRSPGSPFDFPCRSTLPKARFPVTGPPEGFPAASSPEGSLAPDLDNPKTAWPFRLQMHSEEFTFRLQRRVTRRLPAAAAISFLAITHCVDRVCDKPIWDATKIVVVYLSILWITR